MAVAAGPDKKRADGGKLSQQSLQAVAGARGIDRFGIIVPTAGAEHGGSGWQNA
jgi:hypothetical protein